MDHSILNCDQAIPYLKPSLKTSEEAIKVALDDLPVLRKLGYDLLVSYLVDMGDRFQYIQGRHLKSSGLTEEELHAHSIKNLKSLMKAKLEIKPYGPVFAVFLNGNCESSVLL